MVSKYICTYRFNIVCNLKHAEFDHKHSFKNEKSLGGAAEKLKPRFETGRSSAVENIFIKDVG